MLLLQHARPTSPPPSRLLSLPRELRDEIYAHALSNPQSVIIKLPPHVNATSALQPSLTLTSRQLRHETLALFYSLNLFTAQLDHRDDLMTVGSWLRAIGDANVSFLERVALCGWTRVPMGHMISRRWVKVVCDLKGGKLEVEENAGGHPDVEAEVKALGERFGEWVVTREGTGWKVEVLSMAMTGFWGICAGCF